MKLTFQGLDAQVQCERGRVATLEIENRALYCSVCQSLSSGLREQAREPYQLWADDDSILKLQNEPIVVTSPFDLPWGDKRIGGQLSQRFESLLLEDEDIRAELENTALRMERLVNVLEMQLESDYKFSIEWQLSRYLKAFAFGVGSENNEKLIDNLERFIALCADVYFSDTVVFIGLKNFLTEIEVKSLVSAANFSNISLLLIEGTHDCATYAHEIKWRIDQDFLEY